MNFSKKKTIALNIIKKRKIKILLTEQKNNECFECSTLNPEYISLNNGIFLCKNCVTKHLKFPKSISNIIKNNLNSLTLQNIQYLCCGGNEKLNEFIKSEYPNLKNFAREYFYQTYAMDYYRKWLEYLIEGGIKPIKPNKNKAYETIIKNNKEDVIKNFQPLKKKIKNFSRIKSESYKKIFNSKYPKIKPIVGSKNSFRIKHSLSRHNNNLNLSSIGNYNNSLENENFYRTNICNYSNRKSNNFKKNFFFSQFNDDINYDKNNITDINQLTEYNEEEKDNKNETIKIKGKINKKIKLDTNIKVLRTNSISQNININNNNIYSKPIYQNYLNTSHNDNYYYNKIKNKNETIEDKHTFVNSIDNLRNYLSSTNRKKNSYILDLKHNSNDIKEKNNLNINNINNNIIINKNLNIFYNDSLRKIFKKKTIGNSFSINDNNNKKQKLNLINNSTEKNIFFMNTTIGNEKNIFHIKNKFKNDWRKKLLENTTENSTYIEKIKVNRQIKPKKKINNLNNIMTETNNYKNYKINNINDDMNRINQKSKIIQRISRVLKTQKEREKMKSLEKIKVNQKENNKNNNKEPINDKTPKGEIKIIRDETPKSEILDEHKKRHTLSIKELINVPSSKKKNFLDIIKSNNLSNKIISPNAKKIIQINTDPKNYRKDFLQKSLQSKSILSKKDSL